MQGKGYKVFSRVLLAAGFLLLLTFVVIPAVATVLISVRDYSVARGILGSKVVGGKNFTQVLGSAVFPTLLGNSLAFSLLPTVLSAVIAIPLALSVGRMKPGFLRSGVTAALLLPAFIPDIILAGRFMAFWSTTASLPGWQTAVKSNPDLFALAVVPLAAVKPLAVSAFAGACAAAAFRDRGTSAFKGALMGVLTAQAASLAAFASNSRELLLPFLSPVSITVFETLDTYMYRLGLQQSHLASASAIWVFKTGLQCVAAVVIAVFIAKMARSRPPVTEQGQTTPSPRWGLFSGLLAALLFILFAAGPMILSAGGVADASASASLSALLPGSLMNSLVMTLGATLLCAVVLTAFTAGLSARYNAVTVTLTLLICAMVNNAPGEYLQYVGRGMADTYYPILLSSGLSLSYVLAAGYLARLRSPESGSPRKALLSCLPYIAAFCGVTAANMWGGYFYQTVYLRNQTQYGVSKLLERIFSGAVTADAAVCQSVVLGVVIPVVWIALGTGAAFVFADKYAPGQAQAADSDVPEQA